MGSAQKLRVVASEYNVTCILVFGDSSVDPGYKNIIKAYLDRDLKEEDLLHGVSFASGGSGYDDFTANITNVISLGKQLEYFKEYKVRIEKVAGKEGGHKIVEDALFILSMGFTETEKGCCGSGTTEFGMTLKGLNTCQDHSKYIYWDAVHFTENMYYIIADEAVKSIITSL
ncbi:SGNH hydrolase-type esterase domain-containing protein [Cynara cardunculus var. scolymus]|uniref:SGNH hydrolase-type esterase domain-containing protein n=1 Tax=Cynara cardunculus var. scolymus TaxID=59895 RepID=A0A118JT95_CYNCS|nr:SGNH hydrolase-type esterase domain-containing protein [Cynara cardunculus var. scolymus]